MEIEMLLEDMDRIADERGRIAQAVEAMLDGFGGDEFAAELKAVEKRRQDAEGELAFE